MNIHFCYTRGSLASLGPLDIHTSLPPRPGSISGQQSVFRHVPVILGRQSVFRQFPGWFPVGKMCSAASRDNFLSAECVPPCPGSFSVGRVCSTNSRIDFLSAECSATSRDDFRSVECVLPRPGSISGRQSVFRHVLGWFPDGRVCSGHLYEVSEVYGTYWGHMRSYLFIYLCIFRKFPSTFFVCFP